MKRHAFKMRLKPGAVAEYKKRHDEIWPELSRIHSEAGISDYSIFFDEETLTLFAVQKRTDDHTCAALPDHPVMRRWWKHMSPLMEVHADDSPVQAALTEVFHMD